MCCIGYFSLAKDRNSKSKTHLHGIVQIWAELDWSGLEWTLLDWTCPYFVFWTQNWTQNFNFVFWTPNWTQNLILAWTLKLESKTKSGTFNNETHNSPILNLICMYRAFILYNRNKTFSVSRACWMSVRFRNQHAHSVQSFEQSLIYLIKHNKQQAFPCRVMCFISKISRVLAE